MSVENEKLSERTPDRESYEEESFEEGEDFSELIKYTIPGQSWGCLQGFFWISKDIQQSPVRQWFVRTLAGEGESIFEGIFSIRQRLRKTEVSMVKLEIQMSVRSTAKTQEKAAVAGESYISF